jgi:GNAT superfamily N-acetyltransferase
MNRAAGQAGPSPQVSIRRADEGEASALSALALESKRHWGYSPQDIERWRPELGISADDIRSRPTFVARLDQTIAGFYSLVPAAATWVLEDFWVAPRFNRRGVGRALLAHASETARAGGASTIAIDADPNAEPFYVACGAIRRGSVPAPTADEPGRTRPQLALRVAVGA